MLDIVCSLTDFLQKCYSVDMWDVIIRKNYYMNIFEIIWLILLTLLVAYIFIRLIRGQEKIEKDITYLLILMTDNKKARSLMMKFREFIQKDVKFKK